MLDNVRIGRNFEFAILLALPVLGLLLLERTLPAKTDAAITLALVLGVFLLFSAIEFFYGVKDALDERRETESEPEFTTVLEVYDTASGNAKRLETHLDPWQLYKLFYNLVEEEQGIYAEAKRTRWADRAYTAWDLRKVMPKLAALGWAHQVGGNNRWEPTAEGARVGRRMIEPSRGNPHQETVKVRI